MQFFVVQTDVSVLQLFFYVFNWLLCYTFFIYSHYLIVQITPQLNKFFSGIFLYVFPHSVKCHLCSQLLFSASIIFCYLFIYVNSVLCHSFALSVSDFCHKANHFFHFHEHCFLLFFLFPWLVFLPFFHRLQKFYHLTNIHFIVSIVSEQISTNLSMIPLQIKHPTLKTYLISILRWETCVFYDLHWESKTQMIL